MSETHTPRVVLDEYFPFRNWLTFTMASGFGTGATAAMVQGIWSLYGGVKQQDFGALVVGATAFLIGGGLLYACYRIGRTFVGNDKIRVSIDEDGVTIGEERYDFCAIRWIGGRRPFPLSPRVQLVLGLDESKLWSQLIPRNRFTSDTEFETLMEAIREMTARKYPRLSIGEIVCSDNRTIHPTLPQ